MAVDRLRVQESVGVPISRYPVALRPLLARMAEKHLPTYLHLTRVSAYAELLATHLRLSRNEVRLISQAALLHDIGKLETPGEILTKPSRLTDAEMHTMCLHTEQGDRIVRQAPHLVQYAEAVRQHHEWYDGRGYPDGAAGEEIALAARVISICDVYDTMVTPRPYADPLPPVLALAELERGAGTQFDPGLVAAFVALGRNGPLGQIAPLFEVTEPVQRPVPLALRLVAEPC